MQDLKNTFGWLPSVQVTKKQIEYGFCKGGSPNRFVFSELLTKNFRFAKQEYKLKLKKGKNNAVDLKIAVEEKVLKRIKKSYNFKLKKDSRHRFFLKLDFEEKSKALHFYLQDLQNPESNVFRSSEPTTGKDFLK